MKEEPTRQRELPGRLSILWVKSGKLLPPNTGGRRRSLAMLREIARSHQVTYAGLLSREETVSPEEERDGYAHRKVWVPWTEPLRGSVSFYLDLLRNALASSLPYALAKYHSPALQRELRSLFASQRFDLVVCDFLTPAWDVIRSDSPTPTVLFQHNIEAQIWRRLAANERRLLPRAYLGTQARRMARWERKLSRRFSGVITVSPEDTRHAREVYGLANVLGDVPTGVDVDHFFQPFPAARHPRRLAFLGSMDWMPNIEAVHWFVDEILPLLRSRLPGIELTVIGRNPGLSVSRLAQHDSLVRVTGTVEDVRPWIAECSALVVPLKSGGGTRIKILEAMAMGIPIVSTSVGAEGLGFVHGQHLLLAGSAPDFARETARLLEDPALAAALASHALALVREKNSWKHAANVFLDLCTRVLPSASPVSSL